MFMQDEKKKMKPDIKKAYLLQKMQAGSPLLPRKIPGAPRKYTGRDRIPVRF